MDNPPFKIIVNNNCAACARSKSNPASLLKPEIHDKDNCCLRCRDFTQADTRARADDNSLKYLIEHNTLKFENDMWVDDVAELLTKDVKSATDKARILYTWIIHNIDFDNTRMDEVLRNKAAGKANADEPRDPDDTLKIGKGVCVEIARLFACLAELSGIDGMEIGGITKGTSYEPMRKDELQYEPLTPKQQALAEVQGSPYEGLTQELTGSSMDRIAKKFKYAHAWNMVKLDDGVPHLIDVTFGMGADNLGPLGEKEWWPSYFTMDSQEFLQDHVPARDKDGIAKHLYLPYAYKEPEAETWFRQFLTEPGPLAVYYNTGHVFNRGECYPDNVFSVTKKDGILAPDVFSPRVSLCCNHAIITTDDKEHPKPIEFGLFTYKDEGHVPTFTKLLPRQVYETPKRVANPKVLAPLGLEDLQWAWLFEDKTAYEKPQNLPISMFMREAGAERAFKCVQWTMAWLS